MVYGQSLKKSNRIIVYIIVLIFLLVFLLYQHSRVLVFYTLKQFDYPISCNTAQPAWLSSLIPVLKAQGYIGIQISYTHSQKQRINCSLGWASVWPPRQINNNDRLKYASLTKIFTSALVLDLVEKKQISLDDPLFKVLDLPAPLDQRMLDIRIKELLQHRAGFNRHVSGDWVFTRPELCPKNLVQLSKEQLDFTPNTRFAYSNFGYCILGEIIAKKHLTLLENVYQQYLFKPNRVNISHIKDTSGSVEYFDFFEKNIDFELNYPHFTAYGGFVGTAQDFSKVLHFIIKNYLEPFLKFNTNFCQLDQWNGCHGLMLYEYQQLPHQKVYWRDGSLPGLTALVMLFEDDRSIVLLANYRGQDAIADQKELRSKIYALIAAHI